MKTCYLLLVWHLSLAALSAQNAPLYKVIDPEPDNPFYKHWGTGMYPTDSFYYVLATLHQSNMVVKLNKQGDIVKQIKLTTAHDNLSLVSGTITQDGSLVFVGHYINWDISRNQAILVKVDADLNLQWMKDYSHPLNSNMSIFGTSVVETDDHQNYIFNTASFGDSYFLCRTDLNGNLLSTHHLIDSLYPNLECPIIKTNDGNLLMCGSAFLDSTNVFSHPVVRKIDLQGNIIWHQTIPIGTHSNYKAPLATVLQNGGYAVACTIDSVPTSMFPPQNLYNPIYILNENGIVQQEVRLEGGYRSKFTTAVITASNGDIIGCGRGSAKGWLYRATSDGNILWQRYFSDSLQRPWSLVALSAIAENPDGSIVSAGYALDSMPNLNPYDSENQNTNIALLVTDADGCLVPGCPGEQFITAAPEVSEANTHLPWLSVTPNPAQTVLSVRIPDRIQYASTALLQLFNALGSLVFDRDVESGVSVQELNVEGVAPGFYYLVLREYGRTLARQKVMVQR
ncbi:MAG TPA: hypothetical protein PLM41_22025 [Saprospiraceae bacterium]|nr:hypothetical protein [Saprospiraceae bacterium]